MTARAAMRKAELQRLQELAVMRTEDTSQDRLKWFFETHGLKTIETPATSYSWLRMAARHLDSG